ncbi:hypothetical protein [Phaeobacter sp. J2-8]|uniref:hypothetical protein n=1 Tax=Phaeobacter sp. J2-8 TaxID=2931394 RepID=UPI001FD26282|nr:hypothetical protein [Phaeobacter sp. J2-8]MCJ7874462.1 hypothetical protein [Phaeobacter sp. J2-8]
MTDLCVAGHFGEWMQGRIGRDGPVALVTLPCPALGVRLWHYPAAQGLRLYGVGLTAQQVRRFLTPLGLRLRGTVRMRALAQLGFGTGVSSARLVALAQLAGWRAGHWIWRGPASDLKVHRIRWPLPPRRVCYGRRGWAIVWLICRANPDMRFWVGFGVVRAGPSHRIRPFPIFPT